MDKAKPIKEKVVKEKVIKEKIVKVKPIKEKVVKAKKVEIIDEKKNIEFLVDKYNPSSIENLVNSENNYFHKSILKKLKIISEDDGMPHIIFYGNPGSGKKTIIRLFLEMIFDKSVYMIDNSKYIIKSPSSVETTVIIKQSDHHIIIEPNNNNNFDRYLIQDVVKKYAKKYPLSIFEKKRTFKTVQINNLDNLSYYAQTSLRRTMEIYSSSTRFIMWCYSLSKVIEPLRSRCLCIHVPVQTDEALKEFIFPIIKLENIEIPTETINNIVSSSNGNIKKILWKLDLFKHHGRTNNSYDIEMQKLIYEISNGNNIKIIRDHIYSMMITNISSNTIIKDILTFLLEKYSYIHIHKKIKIIDSACEYEYRVCKGRRHIIHIETFIENVIVILKE